MATTTAEPLALDEIRGEVLTVKQYAQVMQIGLKFAYRQIEDGIVRHIRLGDGERPAIRIPKSAVRELLERGVGATDQGDAG